MNSRSTGKPRKVTLNGVTYVWILNNTDENQKVRIFDPNKKLIYEHYHSGEIITPKTIVDIIGNI